MDEVAVETFTTSCFIEFSTNGELQSVSTLFSLVLPMSTSLASAGEITVTAPGCTSRFSWHEDLISEICELAGVGKGELLMSMKELLGSLVILNVVVEVETHHELSNDMLPIVVELIPPMWVCPENRC